MRTSSVSENKTQDRVGEATADAFGLIWVGNVSGRWAPGDEAGSGNCFAWQHSWSWRSRRKLHFQQNFASRGNGAVRGIRLHFRIWRERENMGPPPVSAERPERYRIRT